MLKKTITYKDLNGVELTEDFYFNLSKTEIMKMELGTVGGLSEAIKIMVAKQDIPAIIKIFDDLILKAYGVKSADNKRFMKVNEYGVKYADIFKETEAYDILFMELATDAEKAAEFINNIIPADAAEAVKKAEKANHPAIK